jgi:hypothetical protein
VRGDPSPPGIAPPDRGGQILARAYSITSPLLVRGGERWSVQGDGYTRLKLMRQEKGRDARSVREVEVQTRLSASPRGELLLSKLEICGDYNYYYDLYRFDAGGDLDRISDCGRFRFAAPLADGRIAAIRVVNGEGEVVIVNREGSVERSLYRTAPREALAGLAANGGSVVVTSLRDGRWSLIEIADGKVSLLLSDEARHSRGSVMPRRTSTSSRTTARSPTSGRGDAASGAWRAGRKRRTASRRSVLRLPARCC